MKRPVEMSKPKQPSLVDKADSPTSLPVDTANENAILVETHDGLIPKGNARLQERFEP